jgi:hypothetical protein
MNKEQLENGIFAEGWCIIPKTVLFDQELTPTARLVFAFVTSYMAQKGYCWMSNGYIADNFGLSETTVSLAIKQLAKYLKIEYVKSPHGTERQISLSEFVEAPLNNFKDPLSENENPPLNNFKPPFKKTETPPLRKLKGNKEEYNKEGGIKEEGNKNITAALPPPSIFEDEINKFVRIFYGGLNTNMPNIAKRLPKSYIEQWRTVFKKMLEKDKRNPLEIEKVIYHIFDETSSWWAQTKNVRSPAKFRQRDKQGTLFYDIFLQEMNKKKNKPTKRSRDITGTEADW